MHYDMHHEHLPQLAFHSFCGSPVQALVTKMTPHRITLPLSCDLMTRGNSIEVAQAEDFQVGVRVRTRNSPAGLLLGEIVLGCGPDDLGLPPSAGCIVRLVHPTPFPLKRNLHPQSQDLFTHASIAAATCLGMSSNFDWTQ